MAHRVYKKQGKTRYKEILKEVIALKKPIFIIKLETTGLDPFVDRICGITAIKCEYDGKKFVTKDIYKTLVNCLIPMSEEASKVSGITDELLKKNGIEESKMIEDLSQVLGKESTVIGFNTKEFIIPFLMDSYKRCNNDLNISHIFDIRTMAKSVLCLKDDGYGARSLAKACNTTYTAEGFVTILNSLYKRIPRGCSKPEKGFIKSSDFWSKAYDRAYIFFETKAGKVALNARTLYWEEATKGFFDQIDMDSLTDYLVEVTKSKNLYEAEKKLERK